MSHDRPEDVGTVIASLAGVTGQSPTEVLRLSRHQARHYFAAPAFPPPEPPPEPPRPLREVYRGTNMLNWLVSNALRGDISGDNPEDFRSIHAAAMELGAIESLVLRLLDREPPSNSAPQA